MIWHSGAQGSLHISSLPGREQGPTKIPWQKRHGDASWSPKKLARTEGTMVATSINWDTAPIVLAFFSPRQIKWNCTPRVHNSPDVFFENGGTPLNHQFPLNRNDCLTCLITSGPPDFRSQIDPAHLGLLLLQAQETHRVAVFH